MQGIRPFGAETIRAKTLAISRAYVPLKDIEASIRKWRGATGLVVRLNCPYYKEKDTNAHYLQFCRGHTVAAAREKHLRLLAAAIHTCKLKKSTADALTAMYQLVTLGGYTDPGADENGACNALIENLIGRIPEVKPARGTLLTLL